MMFFLRRRNDEIRKLREYNRGCRDERKVCEEEFGGKIEALRLQLNDKDKVIVALQATLADVKTYVNEHLGDHLHNLESVIYDMQYNNDVKRINTERIHQNVDSISNKVLFYSRRVRTKLKKTQNYVNKQINKVIEG